ncbi:hypothetical protein NZK32_12795 [Cyanobium sp. FGCU-52]|nr:hypothetical protein [Cyanobium sp. FGCU52]
MATERNTAVGLSRHSLAWAGVIALLIGLLMALAGWRATTNYSFWKDELFSAAAIADSWSGLLQHWILPDTAPPLYGILLKGWVSFTGPSELGHRSLSLLFALFTLIAAFLFRGLGSPLRTIVTILFLGLSPGFVGHAQEARNYALTMFWATCLTGCSLALPPRISDGSQYRSSTPLVGFYTLSSLGLSLSHYFGYLFAVVILLIDLRRHAFRGRTTAALALMGVLQIWPLLHLVLTGPAGKRLDRVQWIDVTPVIGTLEKYLAGVMPIVGIQTVLLLCTAGCIALLFPGLRHRFLKLCQRANSNYPEIMGEISHLLNVLGVFAILMVGVDLIRPISTARNYVVAIPATAFLMGDLALLIHSRATHAWAWAGRALLATILLALLADSVNELQKKTMPMMNYKALALTVNRTELCSRGCRTTSSPERISKYFDPAVLKPYRDGTDTSEELPVLGLGENMEVQRKLRQAHPNMLCFEPRQSKTGSVFLLITTEKKRQTSLENLHPCG